MANTARFLKKWEERTKAAVSNGDYEAGIRDVKESPGAAANRNIDGYAMGVQQAIASGKVQDGNLSYTLSEWQDNAISKGKANIQTGVSKTEARKKDNMARAIEAASTIGESVRQMPATTFEERKARMNAQVDRMAQVRIKGRR